MWLCLIEFFLLYSAQYWYSTLVFPCRTSSLTSFHCIVCRKLATWGSSLRLTYLRTNWSGFPRRSVGWSTWPIWFCLRTSWNPYQMELVSATALTAPFIKQYWLPDKNAKRLRQHSTLTWLNCVLYWKKLEPKIYHLNRIWIWFELL